jgi:hypothetical protein
MACEEGCIEHGTRCRAPVLPPPTPPVRRRAPRAPPPARALNSSQHARKTPARRDVPW